jgi:nucleotide-binding universal stress UspA family protein
MSLRDILVHVKLYEDWSNHIELAAGLAKAHGARLTGLCTQRDLAVLRSIMGSHAPTVREREAADLAKIAVLEKKFRAMLATHGISGDWQTGEGNASELLTMAGRFHDLIVVEQTDPRTDEHGWDAAGQTVLASGKPTLVVPHAHPVGALGQRVCVAWNGDREAALAVQAALPILMKASAVTVLEGKGKEQYASITRLPPLDVIGYLARHGVTASREQLTAAEPNVGSAILSKAAALKADLVVMGAYGRSRLREWVLGSTTGYVIDHLTLPVLMAH